MNLFELWMDPMFFLHLFFALLGAIGFIWCIWLFKQACDLEQKRNLSERFRKSKKEDREEPEEEEDNEYEDLPDEDKEDPYYKPEFQCSTPHPREPRGPSDRC